MALVVRKLVVQIEEVHSEAGRSVSPPARRAVSAVIANPAAGRYVAGREAMRGKGRR